MRKFRLAIFFVVLIASTAFGQANGKLQLHFIDIGQGDTAILISRNAETAPFDLALENSCLRGGNHE